MPRLALATASVPDAANPMAQSGSRSGTLTGSVTDSTGAVVPGAKVTILNPVTGLNRTVVSDSAGQYQIINLPFSSYHVAISADGFDPYSIDVQINSTVAVALTSALKIGTSSTEINVEASDLTTNDSGLRTEVDRSAFDKLPLESQSSGLSSLVTLETPGVSADSNGLVHGLGDHASNTFAIDGQQITDQQSKTFSNQLPSNSVQSIQVISGAPPAEYGGKTSLVIDVTTRSGLGVHPLTGSITTSYGTFGSSTGAIDLSYGGKNYGNFFEIDGLDTGRFLDPPEFTVFHAKGNEQNIFDRIDRQLTQNDSLQLDLNYSRSWFQTPNAYDNLNVQNIVAGFGSANPTFGNVGNTDQRSKIETFDIAPTYTRTLSPNAVFKVGPYVRKDTYNYYPSFNPLTDRGPANLQTSSITQARTLTNAGVHSDISYVHGIHNIKVGGQYQQTFLRENDALGIVDPFLNAPCTDANGNPLPGYTTSSQCGTGTLANPGFNAILEPYDLSRGGTSYHYFGQTDVKELALYVQDQITTGNWLFNVGIRGDLYNGLTVARQAEPRLGASYTVKRTGTVLRTSYARTLETPFNENLVLSSQGCGNAVLSPILLCSPGVSTTLKPGYRNEFHAGFEQSVGKSVVISADYIWKYTHNAFDFAVLGNTPITFPIDWASSKIPGFALRADVPNVHNFSGYVAMSSVAARFFPPQSGGAGATVGQSGLPFRIDHDERFNQTTHVQYQFAQKRAAWFKPWISANWRFDSGQVAGNAPCYPNFSDPNSNCGGTPTTLNGQPAINLSSFTADEEFQAGLTCNGVAATPFNPLPTVCLASQLGSTLLNLTAPGTQNNDRNPQRIQPRNLFDASLGQDDLFSGKRYKWSARLTAVNITNKYALYNFLSTFSGTHYVTPRTLTAELGFHF
ncbi:MAG: TonB-dependent receptor [Acidobacteria bacterium]|nr:TonB-dependent receptor [Acidobacteriota bacterium]